MEELTADKRRLISEQLEIARAKIRATGVTVLSPTAEWTALRKEILELQRKLK